MISAQPAAAFPGRLPPLSGSLLALYRCLWTVLGLTALAVLIHSLMQPGAQLVILTLRLVKAAIVLTVAAILFRRRPGDPVAALLSLALLCWTVTSSVDFTASATLPLLLDRVRFLLFALALLLFPDGEWRPCWTRHVAAASAGAFLVGVAGAAQLLPSRLFLPLAIPCVLAGIAALIQRFRTAASEAQRQQLKWVALGLSSGVALILCARAGAAIAGRSAMPPAGPALLEALFQLGIVLIALGFLVSLLRYRLFDVETAISRSAAYAVLTATLIATFAGTEALIETLGQRYLGSGLGNVSAAMAAAVAAVLLTPLHNRISSWAEERFQRDLVTLKQQLPELLAELAAGSAPRRLGAAVLPRIVAAIHATRAALIVDGTTVAVLGASPREVRRRARERSGLPSGALFRLNREDHLFPLAMAMHCPFGSVRGWLLIGPRPDGTLHGRDDLDALSAIAPAFRQALFAVRERQKERARERRLHRKLLHRVEQLSVRLSDVAGCNCASGRQAAQVENAGRI